MIKIIHKQGGDQYYTANQRMLQDALQLDLPRNINEPSYLGISISSF